VHNFPRPTTATVSCARTPVAGTCPECGAQALASYRVMSEGGWWRVVKCGQCLHSVSREPGPLLGAFVPLGAP
jgi:vanillate/4-hydroxybenzoate decarboxylase subunit D